MGRERWVLVLGASVLLLGAAGPKRPGTTVEGAGGGGKIHALSGGGCAGPQRVHEVDIVHASAEVEHRFDNGVTLAGGGRVYDGNPLSVRQISTCDDEGQEEGCDPGLQTIDAERTLGQVQGGVGYDWKYAGGTVGAAWQSDRDVGAEGLYFAGDLWVGIPALFAYGALLPLDTPFHLALLELGVGHHGQSMRLALAFQVADHQTDTQGLATPVLLRADFAVGGGLWLGAGAIVDGGDHGTGLAGQLRLGIDLDRP